jgi:hypothetical protein
MSYSIHKFSEEYNSFWDKYVWDSDNGNLFHTRRFLSYHPEGRFKDHSLIFKSSNKVKALFPAIEVELDKDKTLFSHRGSSFGGIIYNDLGIKEAFKISESLKDYARENKFSRIIITTPPLVYMSRFSNYFDFAFLQSGFRYMKREISSIVQLSGNESSVLSSFRAESRTAVRKSIKSGVQVRLSEDYEDYYKILKQNLRMRHDVNPTHSLEEIIKLKELFPENIHLWGAYLEEKLIAGVINFICNDNVILAFYISDDKTYQNYRPVNQLFYHIFQWSLRHHYQFYDFGIFTVNMEPNWGLGKFKESFGARGLFRDTFEILL